MLRKGMTILEALQKWMSEFNALPNSMIETLIRAEPYDWCEITMPSEGNTVHVTGMPDIDINGNNIDTYERTGVVTKIIHKDPRMYIIELHDGIAIQLDRSNIRVQYDCRIPTFDTMWMFKSRCDENWLTSCGGVEIMSDCGFRIFKSNKWGHVFGVDSSDCSIYADHFVPLYKKRRLNWHDPLTEAASC